MDVLEWLNAEIKASGIPKKTIAERAGLADASALSRILHGPAKPRHHQLEAIARAIGKTLSEFYAQQRPPVGVRDAREALRVLADFVKQHDTTTAAMPATAVPATPKKARSNAKPRASVKRPRSHKVKPFHAAANPNAVLINSDDDED